VRLPRQSGDASTDNPNAYAPKRWPMDSAALSRETDRAGAFSLWPFLFALPSPPRIKRAVSQRMALYRVLRHSPQR